VPTFTSLGGGYAKDQNKIYYEGQTLSGTGFGSFQVLIGIIFVFRVIPSSISNVFKSIFFNAILF